MALLLNKIPVLDKGFVAKVDSSCNSNKLNEIAVEYFKRLNGGFMAENVSTLTLLVKCPLFVQLNFSTFGLNVVNMPLSQPIETYTPNLGEVGAPNHFTSKEIAQDIANTSEALMMNTKSYAVDGCDRFISQIIMPISTYTTIIVHGMYNDWKRFVLQKSVPLPISPFVVAVDKIMKAEWQ